MIFSRAFQGLRATICGKNPINNRLRLDSKSLEARSSAVHLSESLHGLPKSVADVLGPVRIQWTVYRVGARPRKDVATPIVKVDRSAAMQGKVIQRVFEGVDHLLVHLVQAVPGNSVVQML
jgi:hypothetical protein